MFSAKRLGAITMVAALAASACGGDDDTTEGAVAEDTAADDDATEDSTATDDTAPADDATEDTATADTAADDDATQDSAADGDGDASADADESTLDPVRIAFLPLVQANPYIAATLEGIEDTAERRNATVQTFDANFDASAQFGQCQDAIASEQYDAFIVVPVDQSIAACLEDAIAAGIEVVNTDFPIGPDPTSGDPQIEGQAGTVLDPPALRGEWIYALIEQACADVDPCETAIITGVLADPYSTAVNDRVTELADESDNVDIVTVREGFYLADPSFGVAQDILQAHPDLSVIATTSDPMTTGAEEAVRGAGLLDQVTLLGGGASSESFVAIPDGRWLGTFLSLPFDEGRIGAEIAIDAVRGTGEVGIGLSAVEDSGMPAVVVSDNIAELTDAGFTAQW